MFHDMFVYWSGLRRVQGMNTESPSVTASGTVLATLESREKTAMKMLSMSQTDQACGFFSRSDCRRS